MEYNNNRYSGSGRGGFSIGNILGDPFALATVGIALCGWLIAFVSSIIADIQGEFPNYSWWCLAYMFCTIIGVAVAVGMDAIHTYHVAIVGFLAAGLVFTTSSVNSLIYWAQPAKEAAAAGFILLSMVSIVWMFYYGSQPSASHRQTMDSFALHKDHAPSRTSRHMTQSYMRPETTHSSNHQPQMYNSAQLAGFETSSPVTGYPGGAAGAKGRPDSTPAFPQPGSSSQQNLSMPQQQQQQQQQQPMQAPSQADSAVAAPTEYPYRAKAIYSYEANPDDANEISFSKHEILEEARMKESQMYDIEEEPEASLPPGMKRWWGGSLDFSSPRGFVEKYGYWEEEEEERTGYSGEEEDLKMQFEEEKDM